MLQALKSSDYGSDSMLRASGITISSNFTQVDGRVLQPPKVDLSSLSVNCVLYYSPC